MSRVWGLSITGERLFYDELRRTFGPVGYEHAGGLEAYCIVGGVEE